MKNKYLLPDSYPSPVLTSLDSDKKPTSPFRHSEIKKSIEKITTEKSPRNNHNVLEDLIFDKARTLKASVNALLEEISLREELNVSLFKKIDGEVCRLNNELMGLDNLMDSYPFDLSASLDEARFRIKESVFELERERRAEGVECWRDLMGLRRDLMTSLKDYWELNRRREVLEGN